MTRCGATTFVRIGTCGTFQDAIQMVIFDAVSFSGIKGHVGTTQSENSFYAGHAKPAKNTLMLMVCFTFAETRSANSY